MWRAAAIAVLLAVAPVAPVASAALGQAAPPIEHGYPHPLDGLDAYIREALADWRVPGLAIAVVEDDSVVLLRGYGLRQIGVAADVDEHTVFALSSNTKAFTAAALGILVSEGKLGWDEPVIQHMPWFLLPDPWVTEYATVRDLLAHRLAGDAPRGWAFVPGPGEEWAERAARIRRLQPGTDRFRSRFRYCNPCYSAAGALTEAVSGTDWGEFVRARLLEPLGMAAASTGAHSLWEPEHLRPCYWCGHPGPPVSISDALAPNVAMSHFVTADGVAAVPWAPLDDEPAGSMNASAADMAVWLRFQLGRGSVDGRSLLAAAVADELHAPQIVVSGTLYDIPPEVAGLWSYALGWYVGAYRGRRIAVHGGGGGNGFRSMVALIPEPGVGVAVLTNANMPRAPTHFPLAITLAVLDRYLGVPPRDWSADYLERLREYRASQAAEERRRHADRVTGTRPSRPLSEYTGEYWSDAARRLRIDVRDGRLVARLDDGWHGALEHWQHDTFRVLWDGPEAFIDHAVFSVAENGCPQRVAIEYVGEFERRNGCNEQAP